MEKDEAGLLEKAANELIASKKLVMTSRGAVWFHLPTIEDKIISKSIFNTQLAANLDRGILSADDMLKEYINLELWSDIKEKNLEVLPGMISEMVERVTNERNRTKKKKLEEWLRKLGEQYSGLIADRNTRLSNCAEYLAHDTTSLYLLWSGIRKLNGKRFWKKYKDIETEDNVRWVEQLLEIYIIQMQDLEEKTLRQIARSTMWRIRWNAFKDSSFELFGTTSQNLSNDQFMLVYWSQVYDSVYESIDRPPEDVVMDDEALDKWLLEQNEERKREIGQRYHGKGVSKKGNSKIDNANEVFRVVDGYFDDDGLWVRHTDNERWDKIDKIRDLNSPVVRKIKSNEEKKLAEKPGVFIQENELRKTRQHREAMGGNVTNKRS